MITCQYINYCSVITEFPIIPENLCATDITSESVKLAWTVPIQDGVSTVTAYGIFQRRAAATEDEWEEIGQTCRAIFIVPLLEMGTVYDFKVTSRNKVGDSKPAFFFNVKTAGTIGKYLQALHAR